MVSDPTSMGTSGSSALLEPWRTSRHSCESLQARLEDLIVQIISSEKLTTRLMEQLAGRSAEKWQVVANPLPHSEIHSW